MRRIAILLVLLASTFAGATVPITGNAVNASGQPTTNVYWIFEYVNTAGCELHQISTGAVITESRRKVSPNGSGVVSDSIIPNNDLECNGTTYTQTQVTKYVNNVQSGRSYIYTITAAFNLNSPPTPTGLVPAPKPALPVYLVSNPTATQQIVQPAGTAFEVVGTLRAASYIDFTGTVPDNPPAGTFRLYRDPLNNILSCLRPDGGSCWPAGGGGGGGVTSVAMSVPTGLSVTGSPVTGVGTFALVWNGQVPASSLCTGAANSGTYCDGGTRAWTTVPAGGGGATWGGITGTLSAQTDLASALAAKIDATAKTGAGSRVASSTSVPADGCATWVSGNIGSTGSACGTGGGSGLTSLNGLSAATQVFASTNDTNMTLTVNSVTATHTFVLAWQGALAKARQHAATVYTDQGNTYTTGAQDFGAATSLKVPTSAGAAPTANGQIAYDSTANKYSVGVNAGNKKLAYEDSNITGTAAGLSGASALPNGTTATTQSQGNNSTNVATTAYVDGGLAGKAATNAATTVNGQSCALGSTCTVTDSTKVPTTRSLTGGAGIAPVGDLSADRTISLDTSEAGSVSTSAITCGAATAGKLAVTATTITACNNAGTPGQIYAALADSTGKANSAAAADTAANLSGTPALPNGTTATTQTQGDNSTRIATTAYADALGATKAASNASMTVNGTTCTLGGSCSPSVSITDSRTLQFESPAAGDVFMVMHIPVGATITRVFCSISTGTNMVIGLYKTAEASVTNTGTGTAVLSADGTCTTSGLALTSGTTPNISSASVTSNTPVVVRVTSQSGAPALGIVTVTFTR